VDSGLLKMDQKARKPEGQKSPRAAVRRGTRGGQRWLLYDLKGNRFPFKPGPQVFQPLGLIITDEVEELASRPLLRPLLDLGDGNYPKASPPGQVGTTPAEVFPLEVLINLLGLRRKRLYLLLLEVPQAVFA